jgi:hypothetical protein
VDVRGVEWGLSRGVGKEGFQPRRGRKSHIYVAQKQSLREVMEGKHQTLKGAFRTRHAPKKVSQ